MMLTERRGRILQSLIQGYIATATPVSSATIARNCGLGLSPATIRAEMAQLEEDGYIFQPHTSAGRVPSSLGYRCYVEVLLEAQELTQEEQRLIRHQFYQAGKGIDELMHLTATILSRMLHNVAIVTFPHLVEPQLKLVNLLSLREFSALLILVFQNASYRQQALTLEEAASQEDLSAIANKLTHIHGGKTASEIKASKDAISDVEQQVMRIVLELFDAESRELVEEPYFDGLSQIMNQPEFAKGENARVLMELIEERSLLKAILAQAIGNERLRVIIGSENPQSTMHEFSVVLSRYGLPERESGVIGVVGPTRMPYGRTFSAVRFLSGTMSELLQELHE